MPSHEFAIVRLHRMTPVGFEAVSKSNPARAISVSCAANTNDTMRNTVLQSGIPMARGFPAWPEVSSMPMVQDDCSITLARKVLRATTTVDAPADQQPQGDDDYDYYEYLLDDKRLYSATMDPHELEDPNVARPTTCWAVSLTNQHPTHNMAAIVTVREADGGTLATFLPYDEPVRVPCDHWVLVQLAETAERMTPLQLSIEWHRCEDTFTAPHQVQQHHLRRVSGTPVALFDIALQTYPPAPEGQGGPIRVLRMCSDAICRAARDRT